MNKKKNYLKERQAENYTQFINIPLDLHYYDPAHITAGLKYRNLTLVLSIVAASFMILACKKKDTTSSTPIADSVNMQRNYSDTATSAANDT